MEWSNEKVVNLINLYRDRPVLWDCRLKDYKDKNKKMDALLEIAISFGVKKEEVERKLKNLVCHFLREIKKERDAIKSGAGSDDVYKSKWFCYSNMLFLKDRNEPRGVTDTQDQQTSYKNVEDAQEETQTVEDSDITSERGKKGNKRKLFKSPPARLDSQKKHKFSATEETLSIMKDIQVRNVLKDQYTAFGDQVGMRIRDLATLNAKKIVKHLISNVLFEAEMGKYDNPNSVNKTYSHPFYNVPHFSQSPFSSPLEPGYIPSDPPLPQQRSYSGETSTTIQQSLLSPTPSSSYAPTDSDSIDSISMEL